MHSTQGQNISLFFERQQVFIIYKVLAVIGDKLPDISFRTQVYQQMTADNFCPNPLNHFLACNLKQSLSLI
jgi:hypothetical protein